MEDVTRGWSISLHDEFYADTLPFSVIEELLDISNPGNIVDIFPVLDRLPDFLAPWRPAVLRQRTDTQNLYKGLVQDVVDRVEAAEIGREQTLASRLWYHQEKNKMDELDVAYLAGSMQVYTLETILVDVG